MIIGAEYARNRVEMFNLGSNDRMSVKDIADTVSEVMGCAASVTNGPAGCRAGGDGSGT